jgi:crossover junction endodeoxyribonuclease RuvC
MSGLTPIFKRNATIRILGIDPGLNRTGYGVIEIGGGRLRHVAAGVIRVPSGDLAQRLAHILGELAGVIRATQPSEAVVEKVFVNINAQSTLLLGQARGAALCAAVTAGLKVHEYTALQVKQAVVGYGKADKIQVQKMVQRLLALERAPGPDAADALACSICHAHSGAGSHAARVAKAQLRRARGSHARAAWSEFALRTQHNGSVTPSLPVSKTRVK